MYFKNSYLTHIFLFVIIIFSILITNNKSLDLENLLYTGFSDGFTFIDILNSSPQFSIEKMSLHHAQRFVSYYLLGFLYDFIKIDLRIFLQICVVFFLLLNLIALNILFNYFKIVSDLKFIIILIFFFNPYTSRYFIHAPAMIADLIFFTSFNYLILFIIINKFFGIIFACLICSITRQTSLLLFFPLILLIFYENFNRMNLNKYFILPISIGVIIFINFYLSKLSLEFFNIHLDYQITGNKFQYYSDFLLGFYTFITNELPILTKVNSTLIFLSKFVLAHTFIFIVLLLLLYFFLFKNYKIDLKYVHFLIIFFILSIWVQPFLAGPMTSPINRLTILGNGGLIILFCSLFKKEISIRINEKIYLFLIFLVSSFHHEYSDIYFNLTRYIWIILFISCSLLFSIYFYKKILKTNYAK